jgi:hypothetical protein
MTARWPCTSGNDRHAEIALNSELREPLPIDRKNVADVACEASNSTVVDEFTRCARQRILVALLVASIHPERQHLGAPLWQQPRGESGVSVEGERELTHDLPKERLAALAGDTFFDTTQ